MVWEHLILVPDGKLIKLSVCKAVGVQNAVLGLLVVIVFFSQKSNTHGYQHIRAIGTGME